MKIFISTTKEKMKSVFTEYDTERTLIENIHFEEGSHVLGSIILIEDGIAVNSISGIKECDYLLYHNDTQNDIIKLFDGRIIPGNHIFGDTHKYEPVLKIIFNTTKTDEVKYNEIKEFLFPPEMDILEAKLELLHQCLIPDDLLKLSVAEDGTITLPNNNKGKTQQIKLTENADQKLGVLKTQKDGPFGTGYIAALKDLRDILLPS